VLHVPDQSTCSYVVSLGFYYYSNTILIVSKPINPQIVILLFRLQMAKRKSESGKSEELSKRLDLIAETLLAMAGLTEEEIAQIFGVSEKTIERLFAGNLNKVKNRNQIR